MENVKKFPAGLPTHYMRAFDRKEKGFYVRFIDEEKTDRPYWVKTESEAQNIIEKAVQS